MFDKLSPVGRRQAILHFAEKPLVLIHEALDSLPRKRLRVADMFGGKAVEFGLQFGRQVHFIRFQTSRRDSAFARAGVVTRAAWRTSGSARKRPQATGEPSASLVPNPGPFGIAIAAHGPVGVATRIWCISSAKGPAARVSAPGPWSHGRRPASLAALSHQQYGSVPRHGAGPPARVGRQAPRRRHRPAPRLARPTAAAGDRRAVHHPLIRLQ
jgi:hypothetical protein